MTPNERITQLTQALHDIATADNIEDMEEYAAAIGLGNLEYLEMAYENIQAIALNAIAEEWEAADPWQRITADPATLPEPGGFFMVSFRDKDGDCFTMGAYHYHDNEWYYHNDIDDIVEIFDEVYAYQPWPTAAPYPENEVRE